MRKTCVSTKYIIVKKTFLLFLNVMFFSENTCQNLPSFSFYSKQDIEIDIFL